MPIKQRWAFAGLPLDHAEPLSRRPKAGSHPAEWAACAIKGQPGRKNGLEQIESPQHNSRQLMAMVLPYLVRPLSAS